MPDDGIPDDAPAPDPAAPLPVFAQCPGDTSACRSPLSPQPSPTTFAAKSKTHLRTAGVALFHWWRAVTIEALCVGALWLIGLLVLRVPLAPAWGAHCGAHDPGAQFWRRDFPFGTRPSPSW